jgi:RimJ/RimL family protein N-acetyltransferase
VIRPAILAENGAQKETRYLKTSSSTTVRLHENDRPALRRHFTSLGGEDRRLRFGTSLADASIESYVAGLDFERDGLFAVQDEALELVAVVHVAITSDRAELGLSVIPGARGRGLGYLLLQRAVTFLRNRGIARVFVQCLSENGAMMHLARKSGMRIVNAGAETDAHLELEPANPNSFMDEWLDDQKGHSVRTLRRNALTAHTFFSMFAPHR